MHHPLPVPDRRLLRRDGAVWRAASRAPRWGLGLVLAFAAGVALAQGGGVVLGQPLDFEVQVRLEAPEPLPADCVQAQVMMGQQRVAPAGVRTRVDMPSPDLARVRVQTLQAVSEPVVSVDLTVGCAGRITRNYVLLADPPVLPAAALPPALLPSANEVAAAAASASLAAPAAPAVARGPLSEPPARRAAAPSPPPGRRTDAAPPARAAAAATPPPAQAAAAPRRVAQSPRADERRPPSPPPRAAAPAGRLQLDLLEPGADPGSAAAPPDPAADRIINEALEAVAQAASAARAAVQAASASEQRVAQLEATVAQLRAENLARQDTVLQLQERLLSLDSSGRWVLPLVLLVGLLTALAAWLAWRMQSAQRQQQATWREAVRPEPERDSTLRDTVVQSRLPTSPAPFVTAELRRPAETSRAAPAWPPPAPPDGSQLPVAAAGGAARRPLDAEPAVQRSWRPAEQPDPTPIVPPAKLRPGAPWRLPAAAAAAVPVVSDALPAAPAQPRARAPSEHEVQRTAPMLARVQPHEGAARDVSIEELIDLEQQAEFFIVLGQDEAAVDLLVEHLRSTGGGSPMPYLKLLEIHHRLGDQEAYERTRTRFNHRFNAFAPEWGADIHGGRTLEDYPGVIPRLQQVWARPLDAMAELEALLFRKSRGDLFDLPAYREVLFLYALARDLLDREAADTGSVDLLLPLADGTVFGSTAPAPLDDLPPDSLLRPLDEPDFDARPTSPVDFDISTIEQPASIFDSLAPTAPLPLPPR